MNVVIKIRQMENSFITNEFYNLKERNNKGIKAVRLIENKNKRERHTYFLK